ncbi:hypothetical protein ACHAXS_014439 [Conticribra weissflogii]
MHHFGIFLSHSRKLKTPRASRCSDDALLPRRIPEHRPYQQMKLDKIFKVERFCEERVQMLV